MQSPSPVCRSGILDASSNDLVLDSSLASAAFKAEFVQTPIAFEITKLVNEVGPFKKIDDKLLLDLENDTDQDKPAESSNLDTNTVSFRERILLQLLNVQNECNILLDCVSLACSSFDKEQSTTISALVRENIPLGALNLYSTIPDDSLIEIRELKLHKSRKTHIGMLKNCFSHVASTISQSREKLQQVSARDNIFWNDILSLRGAGWSFYRLPSRLIAIISQDCTVDVLQDSKTGHALIAEPLDKVTIQLAILKIDQTSFEYTTCASRNIQIPPSKGPLDFLLLEHFNICYFKSLFKTIYEQAESLTCFGCERLNNQILLPISQNLVFSIELKKIENALESAADDIYQTAVDLFAAMVHIFYKNSIKASINQLQFLYSVLIHYRTFSKVNKLVKEYFNDHDLAFDILLNCLPEYTTISHEHTKYDAEGEILDFLRRITTMKDLSNCFLEKQKQQPLMDFLKIEDFRSSIIIKQSLRFIAKINIITKVREQSQSFGSIELLIPMEEDEQLVKLYFWHTTELEHYLRGLLTRKG